MTAVAREFGSEVSIYAIWNEPNQPAFLMPQWNCQRHARIGAHLPRPLPGRLCRPAGGRVWRIPGCCSAKRRRWATTRSTSAGKARRWRCCHPVAPLAFMREALCLNSKYRKSGSCSELQMSGYAHHAYTVPAGPFYGPPEPDNVTIGSLSRLSNALNLAARAHAIPANVPIYLTEFGVQSLPNKQLGVPAATAGGIRRDRRAHRLLQSARRGVLAVPAQRRPGGRRPGSSHGGTVGFQTGLEYVSGAPKPLYFGWPIPLTVTKEGRGVSLWGLVRPATGATKVTVSFRRQGLQALPDAQEHHNQQPRLLELQLLDPGRVLARALEQPDRASTYRDRRSPPTEARASQRLAGPCAHGCLR